MLHNINNFFSVHSLAITAFSTLLYTIATMILLFVTYCYFRQVKKQTELLEKPIVTIKTIPDKNEPWIINLIIKNTGNAPAYDISTKFIPDLPYNNTTLNKLNIFKNLPILDIGESIELFFDSAIEYLNSNKPKIIIATITYSKMPDEKSKKKITKKIEINIEERKDQLYIKQNGIHELVEEIKKMNEALFLNIVKKNNMPPN